MRRNAREQSRARILCGAPLPRDQGGGEWRQRAASTCDEFPLRCRSDIWEAGGGMEAQIAAGEPGNRPALSVSVRAASKGLECPVSEVRDYIVAPLTRTSEAKGHYCSAVNLKFLSFVRQAR